MSDKAAVAMLLLLSVVVAASWLPLLLLLILVPQECALLRRKWDLHVCFDRKCQQARDDGLLIIDNMDDSDDAR